MENAGFMNRQRKLNRPGEKICFNARSFTMNPTQSGARFNCSYTVKRQHLTTSHQDSTIFT
jgi:hypothetical protein